MKKVQSNTEKLIEGVNYYTLKQTTWNGIVWTSYNASVGNSKFSCTSLEQLQDKITNYKFETPKSRLLTEKAVEAFGTNV